MPDFSHESLIRQQYTCDVIAGIDEAGRGPLAGPVFAAAVVFPTQYTPEWLTRLNDSKKLSETRREELYELIREDTELVWCIAKASEEEIDQINILQATHLAMARAAKGITEEVSHCLIDGRPVPSFPFPSTSLVKGDSKSYSIAAASVLAKVARDHFMVDLAKQFPQYGFEKHKGYGTKAHIEALQVHGVCPHHRHSFAPVAALE